MASIETFLKGPPSATPTLSALHNFPFLGRLVGKYFQRPSNANDSILGVEINVVNMTDVALALEGGDHL